MGHTLLPKRHVMYAKLTEIEKFAHSLRKPYRERLLQLTQGAYFHVSGMVYANNLNDEETLVLGMLAEQLNTPSFARAEKVQRCLAILLAGEEK